METIISAIIPFVRQILYVLLAVSLTTAVLIIFSLFIRSERGSKKVSLILKITASLTSVCSLIISLLNVSVPIGPLPKPDEAAQTIKKYYDAIQDRNFDTAYRLIHRARIDEIRRTISNFDRDQFAETYATTREYRNPFIDRLIANDESMGRLYKVAFDVSDEVPRNRMFEFRQALIKDLADKHLLNRDALVGFVIDNLREYYKVPQSAESAIRKYIMNRQFESLLDPIFLFEIQRNIFQEYKIVLQKQPSAPSMTTVWRHFIQKLHVAQEEGNWKIRQGLAKPQAVINYLPPSEP